MADKDAPSTPPGTPTPVHIGGESIADRLLPHIKKILVGFIVVAVVITVILAIRWRKQAGQEAETARLAQVLDVARRPVGATMPNLPGMTPPADEPRFATRKERADAVLDAIAKQGVDGPGAFHAAMLADAGKLDEAIAAYRAVPPAKPGKPEAIEGVLAREGLGLALEAKAAATQDPAARQQLLEEALAAFVAMQPDETGPRRAYALYHQGRIQQRLGKTAEAKTAFEKAKELGASTELPELIERRLATL